jgi:hypothetical protein
MASEALREEEVVRRAVDIRYRDVAQRVKRVRAIEARTHLPLDEDHLRATG